LRITRAYVRETEEEEEEVSGGRRKVEQ